MLAAAEAAPNGYLTDSDLAQQVYIALGFDKNATESEDDKRFDAQRDISVIKPSDTRKTRLTLKQINRISESVI